MQDPASYDISMDEINRIFEEQKHFAREQKIEPLPERIIKLKKLEQWILSNIERIHMAVFNDLHKSREESDISEAYVVIGEIRNAIKNLKSWTRSRKIGTPWLLIPAGGWINYEPKGVCLIISPWNFPFNLSVNPLVSALAAGNRVIIKPSEYTPATSSLIKQMVTELFQPKDVYVFEGDHETAKALLSLPFDHVFFTGSSETGKKILESASRNLVPVTLELGGKSPVICDSDCNVKGAADKIVVGKFINCGQTCVAPDFGLVHEEIKEGFLIELGRALDHRYPDTRNSMDYGRIISKKHHKRLVALLEDAIAKGAEVISGGNYDENEGYFEPTILTNVTLEMQLMKEEIFGPILPVMTYSHRDQLPDILNSMTSPLVIYIFTSNRKSFEHLANFSTSGAVCWNDVVFYFLHSELPFGGINESGMGRGHGYSGFRTFSNERAFMKQRSGWIPSKLAFPPFGKISRMMTNFLLRYL